MDVLAEIVADVSLFLENSDEGIVDADAAVTQLELMGHRLQALSDDEKQQLAQSLQRLADKVEHNEEMREQIRALPDAIGFLEEE